MFQFAVWIWDSRFPGSASVWCRVCRLNGALCTCASVRSEPRVVSHGDTAMRSLYGMPLHCVIKKIAIRKKWFIKTNFGIQYVNQFDYSQVSWDTKECFWQLYKCQKNLKTIVNETSRYLKKNKNQFLNLGDLPSGLQLKLKKEIYEKMVMTRFVNVNTRWYLSHHLDFSF